MQNNRLFKDRILELTALRGLAALVILAGHLCDWNWKTIPKPYFIETFTSDMRYVAMPLFFMLSGFVIHYTFAQYTMAFLRATGWRNWGVFIARRLLRLYPLYLLLGLIALIYDQRLVQTADWALIVRYLTLTHSWTYLELRGLPVTHSYYSISWSISTEMALYLCYPLLRPLLRLCQNPKAAFTGMMLAWVLAAALAAGATFHSTEIAAWFGNGKILNPSHVNSWLLYYSPYFKIFDFFIGALCAHVVLSKENGPLFKRPDRILTLSSGLLVLTWLVCAGWISWDTLAFQALYQGCLFLPFIALILLAAPGSGSRFLRAGFLQTCGLISYSLYLGHYVLVPLYAPGWRIPALWGLVEYVGIVGLASVIAFAFAYGSYHIIERPFIRLGKAIKPV